MVEIEKVYRVDGFIFENIENAEKFKSFIEKYNYNKMQKDIIYSGLKNKLNVSLYAKPEFNDLQMKEIRLGLKQGINVESYLNNNISNQEMQKIRLKLLKNKGN